MVPCNVLGLPEGIRQPFSHYIFIIVFIILVIDLLHLSYLSVYNVFCNFKSSSTMISLFYRIMILEKEANTHIMNLYIF